MFIFCPVHFWHSLKWMWTPSASYFVIHLKQSFPFLPHCDKHSVWEVCSAADATGYFRICHISPSFCVTLLFSWIFISCGFYSVDFLFFLFFFLIWPRHLACGILVRNLGVKPEGSSCTGSSGVNHWTSRKSLFCWFLFKKPLLLSFTPSLSTWTHTHRHIHTEPPSPPYSSSSFCQLAYLHPSIEYINPSFWLNSSIQLSSLLFSSNPNPCHFIPLSHLSPASKMFQSCL